MGIKVPEITLKDKIYIKKDDISITDLQNEFVYHIDETFATTLAEEGDYYTLGIGCLNRVEADKVIDLRVKNKLNTQVNFTAKLHPAQQRTLEKFMAGSEVQSGIIKAKCGWGKCKPIFSKVQTDKGYLSLEEIINLQEKVKIINHKGIFSVSQVKYTGKKSCLAIKTQLNNIVRVSEDHPILTWNNSGLEFKLTKDIVVGDNLVGLYNTNIFGEQTVKDPYLFGLLIGDGGLSQYGIISITSQDEFILNYFSNWCKLLGKSFYSQLKGDNTYTYYLRDKKIYESLIVANNLNCLSIDKILNTKLRSLNRENTIALLQGLFDTDGCVNKDGTIEYVPCDAANLDGRCEPEQTPKHQRNIERRDRQSHECGSGSRGDPVPQTAASAPPAQSSTTLDHLLPDTVPIVMPYEIQSRRPGKSLPKSLAAASPDTSFAIRQTAAIEIHISQDQPASRRLHEP